MPMLITDAQRPPVAPLRRPSRTARVSSDIRSRVARISRGHVDAVDDDRRRRRRAQRRMQRRALLRQVHLLAGEQRGDPVRQVRRFGARCSSAPSVVRRRCRSFARSTRQSSQSNVSALDARRIAREQLVQRRRAQARARSAQIRIGDRAAYHSGALECGDVAHVRRAPHPTQCSRSRNAPVSAHASTDARSHRTRPTPSTRICRCKEDTRLLGRVLGDVLRAQTGDAGYERIEAIRQTAIRFRRAARRRTPTRRERDSRRCSNPLPIAQALDVVRAFSYFSHLANIAEDVHQNRRRRAHALAGSPPQRGEHRATRSRALADGRRRRARRSRAGSRDALREPGADRASDRSPAQEHPRRRARDRAAADAGATARR